MRSSGAHGPVTRIEHVDALSGSGRKSVVVHLLVRDFDHSHSDALGFDFEQISDGSRVVLDFSGVDSVNSGVLGSIISLNARMRKTGGVLRLCGINTHIAEVLKITQLEKIFDVHESRAKALAAA